MRIIAESAGWHSYDLPPALRPRAWGGRYRGQKQKWFAMRFTGTELDIDISPRRGHKADFNDWRWTPVSELPRLIVPFKRQVYRDVVREFRPLLRPAAPAL